MIPRRIADATHVLGPPDGWIEDRDGKCARLAVRLTSEGVYESAWEPTPDELAALNAGGSVILRIVSCQPPVALFVEPPAQDEALTPK